LYLTALLRNGLEPSINSAVRRRDSLLAVSPVSSLPNSDPSSSSASLSPSGSHASQSQQIAQAVLSGSTPTPGVSAALPDVSMGNSAEMTKLATALGVGKGVQGNPLYVTLSERKL
jgi:ATP-dependent metalloprotease